MAFLIDAAAARALHQQTIRKARVAALARLDVLAWRAIEGGTPLTDIAARKQALRDLPEDARIAAATDVVALRAVWNDDLGPIANALPPPGFDPLVAPPAAIVESDADRTAREAFIAGRDGERA